jgi:hypothetical protein
MRHEHTPRGPGLSLGSQQLVDRQCGRVAEHLPQAEVTVMLDPEGHPFCLFPDESL